MKRLISSAPARICLFGEHQDYMGNSVIAAAIDLRIKIEGNVFNGNEINIFLKDYDKKIHFKTDNIIYANSKDYLRSSVKVLKEKGLFDSKTIDAEIYSNIPVKAGISSSSAYIVAWISFLLESEGRFKDFEKNREEIGELAYISEVVEFNENGGRMDQYTVAIGDTVYINFKDPITTKKLNTVLKHFVLGDSLEPKDTQKTLKRVRQGQTSAYNEISKYIKFNSYDELNFEMIKPYLNRIDYELRNYLYAVVRNFDITEEASKEMLKNDADEKKLTNLMNEHHSILRDKLNLSTKRIDSMIEESFKAGAKSAKISGSGEGGCMFAYCPGKQEEVYEAILKAGGKPYIINIGKGVEVKEIE